MNYTIENLLKTMKVYNASDLHINVGIPPAIRKDGKIIKLDVPPLNKEYTINLLYSILKDEQKIKLEEELELDFSIEIPNLARFRVNYFYEKENLAAVFRFIPSKIPTFESLNVPQTFYKFVDIHQGIILVTGPTGSGKSTTLASLINEINKKHFKHILTIEDPIEFIHKPINSIISQREVYRDTKSFNNALKSALREDPDVILIGEMRDRETIEIALTAAETGHLVLGTLHTNSAAQTINRIINVFPAEKQAQIRTQLSLTLKAVVSQVLIPKIQGGRIAAHEIMLNNSAIANLIRENKIQQINSIIQTNSQEGMQLLNDVLKNYVFKNIIDKKEAILFSNNKSELIEELNI